MQIYCFLNLSELYLHSYSNPPFARKEKIKPRHSLYRWRGLCFYVSNPASPWAGKIKCAKPAAKVQNFRSSSIPLYTNAFAQHLPLRKFLRAPQL